MSDREARRAQYFTQQYVPQDLSPELRSANALEYIAFNVGIIARAVERLEAQKLPDSELVQRIMAAPQSQAAEMGALLQEALTSVLPKKPG